MQQISFKTPRGADVTLAVITERPADIDQSVKMDCYTLRTTINGEHHGCGWEIEMHPEHGMLLKPYIGGVPTIQVPASAANDVREFLTAYKAEAARRVRADLTRETEPVHLGSFEQEEADEIALNGRRR